MTHLEIYKLVFFLGGGDVVAATCDMPAAGSPKHVARRVERPIYVPSCHLRNVDHRVVPYRSADV